MDKDDPRLHQAEEYHRIVEGTEELTAANVNRVEALVKAARAWHDDWCVRNGVLVPGKAYTLREAIEARTDGEHAMAVREALKPFEEG